MRVSAWLNRPGLVGRIWRPAYEGGYQLFKSGVTFLLTPIFRIRRVGPAPKVREGGVVFCPNHASYLDPAFVQLVLRRRVTFIMTNDFYALPAWRWFFKLVGAVPVGRGRMARKGLRRAMALVRRGHAIVVFPEGRLTRDGGLGRAQRGIGRLARRTGAPVIPVGIAGARHAWGYGARHPGQARVRLAFGPPLTWSAGDTNKVQRKREQEFADRLMARIARAKAWVQEMAPMPGDARVTLPDLQTADSPGR